MVFLDGEFLEQKDAKISTLDRGFLFGDGVYEVIPVYNGKIFELKQHLLRLDKSLNAIKINNPYSFEKYQQIFTQLLENKLTNQVIYLQISRGVGENRSHKFKDLKPTIYIRIDNLNIKTKNELKQGFKASILPDIRWKNCQIKATSLLASVLYNIQAQEMQVEEIILEKSGIITEGSSSNVFILKDNIVQTPKINNNILAGITRDMVLKSCEMSGISVKECDIDIEELQAADEVWISSSTREVMPIAKIDDVKFSVCGDIWQQVYANFQTLKNTDG